MAKFATLFLVALLLCSTLSTFAARPAPALPATTESEGSASVAAAVEQSCEGVSEEECLLRRTLAAHTDYIYTQKHNKP